MTNPVIDEYGTKVWWSNGKRHREDGPAVEYSSGSKCWCIKGQFHREDGPAYESNDGSKEWYIKDIRITDQVEQWIKDNNFPEYEKWDDSIKVLFKLTFG